VTELSIADAALQSGLSAHTLRYYELAGLLPRITRDPAGRRRFTGEHLDWIRFLSYLRATGMPIRRMREYVRLVQMGPQTDEQRRALLEDHRDSVLRQMDRLSESLTAIEQKIAFYAKKEETK
jgi:DNA-binding transcriptional MerR regulator